MSDIETYSEILAKHRNFVIDLHRCSHAVMIFSGGLDSLATTAHIVETYETCVYPLFLNRGQRNAEAERRSVESSLGQLRSRYGRKIQDVFTLDIDVPPKQLRRALGPYSAKYGHPLRDTQLLQFGVQYALSLELTVRAVCCGMVSGDAFPHSGVASIRALNIAVCENLKDWSWQLVAPNIDPVYTAVERRKADEITWCSERGIDLSRTISCNIADADTDFLNCGGCDSCSRRSEAFRQAGIADETPYYGRLD